MLEAPRAVPGFQPEDCIMREPKEEVLSLHCRLRGSWESLILLRGSERPMVGVADTQHGEKGTDVEDG